MKTPMRLVKEVPEIYVDQSRDMQLLLRLMDCVYGGVKFDIDSVLNLTRTDQCKSNYLQLLQSKVGFLSDKKFDLEDLRLALSAFPWLVKNKGSKKAIKQAVNAYLKMRHIKTNFNVNVINRDKENNVDKYVVQIGIEGNIGDTTILDEIFKYILPTGYEVEYIQYEQPETNAVELAYNDSIDYTIPSSGENQTIAMFNLDIPNNYEFVEWIESNENLTSSGPVLKQYIQTNVATNNNNNRLLEFYIDFMPYNGFASSGADSYGCIFGGRQNVYQLTTYNPGGMQGTFQYGNISGVANNNNAYIVRNQRQTIEFKNMKLYTNNTSYDVAIPAINISNRPISIFALNSQGTIAQSSKTRLYRLKFYENNIIVNDFVPCIDTENNNQSGLYDIVNREFLTNSGTGSDFDYGNIINKNDILKEYALMQSVGTQNLLEKEN